MDRGQIIGTVALAKMSGATFCIRHLFVDGDSEKKYRHIVLDLMEDGRPVWRYWIVFDVLADIDMCDIDAPTTLDFAEEQEELLQRAINGDEDLYAEGEILSEDDADWWAEPPT